jgi:UDP-N-acetylglucosamine 2-epimerase
MATKQMINGMKNLDKLAYHIVCNWYKEIKFNPVFDGIDYSQILRFYLWDKVGRAIRIKNNISFNEIEFYKEDYKSYPFYHTPLLSKGKYKRKFFSRKKTIFIPFQTSQTALLTQKLQASKKVKVISKQITKQLKKENVIRALKYTYKEELGNTLFNAVIKAFDKLNVDLIAEDKELLKLQINGAVKITALAESELLKYKANAVYVHSDNHPPFINYVLVAKKYKIPTFMYQHGLDCEHYYLDDCYADHVAVWSENRKERYISDSITQPKSYAVIGNVLLSKQNTKKSSDVTKTIVFATRPHKAIKCYSPSRSHIEGVEILQVILDVIKLNNELSVILKLHPMDSKDAYVNVIKHNNLEHRVIISNEKLNTVFEKASVIITEDSTAGAEAMFFEKPCIHAHFANSDPVLPFVKYGSAFPGFSKEELMLSLTKALSVNDAELNEIKRNQKNFIKDFISLGDIDKLVTYISENI